MKKLILLFALCFIAPAAAQERPIAGTTLQSTDTTANSLLIGCAVGSTTCTGGIKAGALVIGGGTSITSSSNIALLSASNVFTAQSQTTGAGGVGGNAASFVMNGGSGAGGGPTLILQKNAGTQTIIGAVSSITGSGTSSDLGIFSSTGNGTVFYTNAVQRWGINAAGDFTFGTTPFIYLSAGTPTINSGFGVASGAVITGTDNGFTVTLGTVASTAGVVTFGHTMSNVVCTANGETAALNASIALGSVSGSSISFAYTSSASLKIYVVCVGKP